MMDNRKPSMKSVICMIGMVIYVLMSNEYVKLPLWSLIEPDNFTGRQLIALVLFAPALALVLLAIKFMVIPADKTDSMDEPKDEKNDYD
jgi:hypothetical protein